MMKERTMETRRNLEDHQEVFSALATADEASVCCLLSTTAHPSHWTVCAHDFSLITYVLTQRWSGYSQQILQWIVQWQDGDAGVSAAAPPNKGQALQCIQNVIVRESQGTLLLLNYGVSSDLSAVTRREASEFKGALDAMFEAHLGRLPAEADDNAATAREEEEAAKARAAAEAVPRLVRVSAEEELHRKRKLEEEAKQQEEDA